MNLYLRTLHVSTEVGIQSPAQTGHSPDAVFERCGGSGLPVPSSGSLQLSRPALSH